MPERGRPKRPLILTAQERAKLQQWARQRTIGVVALRSRIVLATADGQADNLVAERFGVTPKTIGKWRGRFTEQRLGGLADEARPGAPRKVTDDLATEVVARTLGSSPPNADRWTTRSLAEATALSQTSIVRIWQAHGLRLRRRRGQKPVIEQIGRIVRLPRRSERHPSRPLR